MRIKSQLKKIIKVMVPRSLNESLHKYLSQMASRVFNQQLEFIYQKLAVIESLEYKIERLEKEKDIAKSLLSGKEYDELEEKESSEYKADRLEKEKGIAESLLSDKEYDELENRVCAGRVKAEGDYYIALIQLFPEKARVLDLGCGKGRFIKKLNEGGFFAQGIDLNSSYSSVPNITIGELPKALARWDDNSIDVAVSFHLIEHLELSVYRDMLDEVYRILDAGGKIYLETPNTQSLVTMSLYYYKDPAHLMPRHPEAYANILRFCGFKNVIIKNLPELDNHTFESIKNIDTVDDILLAEVNKKFQEVEDILFSGSNNVLIVGEK